MNKSSIGFAHIFLILVVVIIAIGGVGYLMYQNGQIGQQDDISKDNVNEVVNEESKTTPTSGVTINWQTYTDEEFGFSIKYPHDWFAGELPPAGAHYLALGLRPNDLDGDYSGTIIITNDGVVGTLKSEKSARLASGAPVNLVSEKQKILVGLKLQS